MERIKNFKRRSVSIPNELDKLILFEFEKSGYTFLNDMIIELIENGIIRQRENRELDEKIKSIDKKLDELISR